MHSSTNTKFVYYIVVPFTVGFLLLLIAGGVKRDMDRQQERLRIEERRKQAEFDALVVPDWKTVELSGKFNGRYTQTYYEGEGQTQYSFASERTLESGGDIGLKVAAQSGAEKKIIFKLSGYDFYDLGPNTSLPQEVPSFYGSQEEDEMKVGHYYVLKNKDEPVLLVQILDVDSDLNFKYGKDVLFGLELGTRQAGFEADASVKFRYILAKNFTQMEKFFKKMYLKNNSASIVYDKASIKSTAVSQSSNLKAAGEDPSPSTSVSQSQTLKAAAGEFNPKTLIDSKVLIERAASLVFDYEDFQKKATAFLDLPIDAETSEKCANMLYESRQLIKQASLIINDLNSLVQLNNTKISNFIEKLKTIQDLQIKDRVQSQIKKLKEQTGQLQKTFNEWNARLSELNKTERKLDEYLSVVNI